MHVCMYACMHVSVYACVCACMRVCVCVSLTHTLYRAQIMTHLVTHTQPIFLRFLDLFGPWRKSPEMASKGAGKSFLGPIQTLPTFWATWILILRIFIFETFLDSKFLDFQVPRWFPIIDMFFRTYDSLFV